MNTINSLKKWGVIASSVLSLSFVAMSSALASSASSYGIGKPPSGWFVGVGSGVLIPRTHNAINRITSGVNGNPSVQDVYTAGAQQGVAYDMLLDTGYQWSHPTFWLPEYSVGLEYQYVSPTSINGVINRYSIGNTFYDYKYNVSQQLFLLHLKLDLLQWHHLMPFVSASAGLALNKADSFSTTPVGAASSFNPNFGSAVTPQFAYGFGAGVDYWLRQNIQMTLAYQYLCAGQVKTGKSRFSQLGSSTVNNNLSSNAVLLKAAYIFN